MKLRTPKLKSLSFKGSRPKKMSFSTPKIGGGKSRFSRIAKPKRFKGTY